jgi:hypothetical protein
MIKKELKELLQKHDSEIFTDELVEGVSDLIQTSIDTEVSDRVKVIQSEKERELAILKESISEKSDLFEKEEKERFNKLIHSMSKWTQDAIDELFEANKVDYENVAIVNEAVEVHKANKLLAEKYHISIEGLEEDMSTKKKLEEAKEMYNDLYHSYEKLNEDVDFYSQSQIIDEVTEGMTELQKNDLVSLADSLNESNIDVFREKITNIKNVILKKPALTEEHTTTVVNDATTTIEKELLTEDEKSIKSKYNKYNMFGPI